MSERIPMLPPYRVVSRVQILSETLDYNHELMNIPDMWRKTKGEGVRVAILDSGLPQHTDLRPSGGKSFIPGYLEDQNGHATHVGGIIAAVANNGMGIAGIAPECEDYYGAVLDKNGGGEIWQIVDGIRWAVDDIGAHIISMSLGIPAGYEIYPELEEAVNYAHRNNVAVICAAGNEAGGVGQPACYDNAIAVAAVNNQRQKAGFSNTGPEIDFAAGGVDVYSTYLNNGYAKLSGTSMACPALVGLAALILADEYQDHEKWLAPDELKEKMKLISFDVGPEGFDELYGHGIPMFKKSEPEPPVEPPIEPPVDPPIEPPIEPPQPPIEPPSPPEPPVTPPLPPPRTKKSEFPCGMAWKLMGAFANAAGEAERSGADPDGAILAGFAALGNCASLTQAVRKKE